MKLLESNTGYILLKAMVNSEWDEISYALVKLNDNDVESLKKAFEYAVKIGSELDSFYTIELFQGVDAWLDFNDDLDELTKGGELLPVFLELSDEEVAELIRSREPEERICGETVVIRADGDIIFRGYGKYSDHEFSTESININQL